jgi:hypothetical protein
MRAYVELGMNIILPATQNKEASVPTGKPRKLMLRSPAAKVSERL